MAREWTFWAEDTDRSWGWSNHVYTLGRAFVGFGPDASAAITEARAARRDDYVSYVEGTDRLVGDTDAQHEAEATGGLIAFPNDAEQVYA